MATIDSRSIIDRLIAQDGYYDLEDVNSPDNAPAIRITEYLNAWGKITWGVVFAGELDIDRYNIPTQYIRQPKIIWERKEPQNESI